MVNNILIVGSSIEIAAIGSGFSISANVSPISNPSIPTIAQISPAGTSSTLIFAIPSNNIRSLIRERTIAPSRLINATGIFVFNVPRNTRPTAIRPTKEE